MGSEASAERSGGQREVSRGIEWTPLPVGVWDRVDQGMGSEASAERSGGQREVSRGIEWMPLPAGGLGSSGPRDGERSECGAKDGGQREVSRGIEWMPLPVGVWDRVGMTMS
jgi:hypothetical protein